MKEEEIYLKDLKEEQKENRILRTLQNFKNQEIKYKTKCVFCGKEIITIKNTANEGICFNCRCD